MMNDGPNSVSHELTQLWKDSQPLFQQWWYEADLDTKMVTGQQDYWNSFYNINYRNQKILMFNKILRVYNMIGGYQRKNRLATIVTANHTRDDQGADDRSEVLHHCYAKDNTYEKISECFDGSNITGLNLLEFWMDYRQDPENGELKTCRLPFNSFLMDPYWTQSDLSDCGWIWTRRYITRQQLLALHPDMKGEIPAMNRGVSGKDGRFQFLAQNWYQYNQELFAYDQLWKREYRKAYKILDKMTGEVAEWGGDKDQFKLLKRYNPNVQLIKINKPSVKLFTVVNNITIYEESRPYGIDKYPFVPFTCYHFPEVQNYAYRYQGVVRNIRDSQIELNRRRNRMLDILDSQVQSGLLVKEDALVNPEDAFLQGPGRVQFFKQSANLATDVQHVPPPNIPQSLFELERVLDSEIMSIAGVNEELFGESGSNKDMSGVLNQQRMGAALVSLQGVFDRLNQSQMAAGALSLDLVSANFSKGKIEAILGRDVEQDFSNLELAEYGFVCEEAALTSSQKQLEFLQAFQMKQLGMPIPMSFLLEKATMQGKKELMDAIKKEEQQAAQMQQMQQQGEIQKLQMESRQLESVAQANFAAAKERETRAASNIGLAKERSSQAIQDKAKAHLDNASAIQKLDQVQEERLYNLGRFIAEMDMAERQLSGGEEDDSVASAAADTSKIEEANQRTSMNQPQGGQPQQPNG